MVEVSITNKAKVSVTDIVEGVLNMIRKGELLPGKPLREVTLCEKFGVSRTPVREALRLLQNKGMVEYIPRRGVQIVELTESELNDITNTLITLETLISRQAAEKITTEQVEELRQLNEIFCNSCERAAGMADNAFHLKIAEFSANKVAAGFLADLKNRQACGGPQMGMKYERIKVSYHEHDAIIRALESRDPELAALQTTFHFQMARKTQMAKIEAKYRNCKQQLLK